MKLIPKYLSKEELPFPSQQFERIDLYSEGGQRLAHVFVKPAGYTNLSREEIDTIGRHLEALLTSYPVEIDERTFEATPPSWHAIGGEARTVRTRSGTPGVIRIPAGATFLENGEIYVPPRSEDGKSPDAKKFRRACRAARNAVRELAAKDGRTVEQIMLELRGIEK